MFVETVHHTHSRVFQRLGCRSSFRAGVGSASGFGCFWAWRRKTNRTHKPGAADAEHMWRWDCV